MITHDTIITVELLAGLDKCPFCSAPKSNSRGARVSFTCWTQAILDRRVGEFRGITCEITTLRARVFELEAQCKSWEATALCAQVEVRQLCESIPALETKVKRLTEAGDRLYNPFAVGENDIKAWTKAKEGV